MYIIVGLGNPSKEYNNTRHNIGFDVIDALSEKYSIPINNAKYKSLVGTGVIDGIKVVLMKPQTFMNLSGEAVRAAIDFYKISPEEDLLVVCDDIYLEVGRMRIREKGSAGGHNGLKNIILHTGTESFTRLRMGVGNKGDNQDLAAHVLGYFSKEERAVLTDTISDATDAIRLIVSGNPEKAMNIYNKKKAE